MAYKTPKSLTYATWAEECAAGVGPAWLVVPVGGDLYLVDPDTDLAAIDGAAGTMPVMLRDDERRQLAEIVKRERTRFRWSWRANLYTVHNRLTEALDDSHTVMHRSPSNRNRAAAVN